jgi:hypothetical protein
MRNWLLKLPILGLLITVLAGCGYTFQTSGSPLSQKEGVRKIYVEPFINNTYKAGVENVVYNALVRSISVHRRVRLVSRPEQADAVLKGYVNEADFLSTVSQPAHVLPSQNGVPDAFKDVLVSTEYSATLSCTFSLERQHPGPRQRTVVWRGGFTRSKPFAGSNQLGVRGTTSALINESEFDRALSDIANSMTGDVHESMLAMF